MHILSILKRKLQHISGYYLESNHTFLGIIELFITKSIFNPTSNSANLLIWGNSNTSSLLVLQKACRIMLGDQYITFIE